MSGPLNLSKKSLAFITGASKGIGQTIAIELSKKLGLNSTLVLLARSTQGLEETKEKILEVTKSVTVKTYSVDLSKPNIDTYNDIFNQVTLGSDISNLDTSLLFHNAGHVGDVKKTTELTDLTAWREYYDLNFFSVVLLNSVFLEKIRPISKKSVIVNITSLVGRVPFENMAMYGSAKASREIFFKVLAIEEPEVTVLNYSPGPVQTDMFDSICENAESEKLRNEFREIKEKKSILSTDQTVGKLLDILEKGEFKNGDTVDYFDRE